MQEARKQNADGDDNEDDLFLDKKSMESVQQVPVDKPEKDKSVFKVYSLSDLSPEQVAVFVQGTGITNSDAFLKEIERQDAWSFTSRPQDLEETVEFWNKHGRLGSPLELIRHSIDRRLIERDQDRAEANPLTIEQVTEGARMVAAAAILGHESTIRVPDGTSAA